MTDRNRLEVSATEAKPAGVAPLRDKVAPLDCLINLTRLDTQEVCRFSDPQETVLFLAHDISVYPVKECWGHGVRP